MYRAFLFNNTSLEKVVNNTDDCNKLAVESHIREWLSNGHRLDCIVVMRSPLSSLQVVTSIVSYLNVTVRDGTDA